MGRQEHAMSLLMHRRTVPGQLLFTTVGPRARITFFRLALNGDYHKHPRKPDDTIQYRGLLGSRRADDESCQRQRKGDYAN